MSDEIKVHVVDYGSDRNLMLRYRDPVSGKQIARSAGTRNRRVAERRAAEWEAELRAGHQVAPSRITWAEFVKLFAAEKLDALRQGSRATYEATISKINQLLAPDRLVKMAADEAVRRFTRELQQQGCRPATVARHLRHLKAMLRWAVKRGMLGRVPVIEMPKLPGGVAMRGRPITAEEFDRMLAAVSKVRPNDRERWQRYLRGLWLSGLRLSESLLLSWEPEDPIAVVILGQDVLLRFRPESQKGYREEVVPVFPDFGDFLLAIPEHARRGRVFKIYGSANTVGKVIGVIGRAAGVITDPATGQTATAHDLRRSCLTRWARYLAPAELQRMARHSSYTTTERYYVQLDARQMAASLRERFGSQEGNNLGNAARCHTSGANGRK